MWWLYIIGGGVLLLVLLVVLVFVGLVINLRLASAREAKRQAARLAPVDEPLSAGETPDPAALQRLAADPLTRSPLFLLLQEHGRLDLYPKAFATRTAFAESDLVTWLAHPNELKGPPDGIELVSKHKLDSGGPAGVVRWYLFRFCTHAPHWAADKGWMAGVGGPFPDGYVGPIQVPVIRSELTPLEEKTPEQHVREAHERAEQYGAFDDLEALKG
ncbi:MAG: hypothetical protein AAGB29_04270 [Planctomycetota bacterium]